MASGSAVVLQSSVALGGSIASVGVVIADARRALIGPNESDSSSSCCRCRARVRCPATLPRGMAVEDRMRSEGH